MICNIFRAKKGFKIYLEQSGWTAADLQTEIQAIGGTMASATVTDGTL